MTPGGAIESVFLDRDGVINEEVDLLHRADQLRLIPGSAEAISLFNAAGLPVVVVTNQPVVARGLCTEDDIRAIHDELERQLAGLGARVDAIEFCPHHPNADLPAYRVACECRKPRPGMILRAAARLGLDPSRGVMVGDRTADLAAARAAGCVAVLVRTGYAGADGQNAVEPDLVCDDLLAAARLITANRHRSPTACTKP
jgi:D-glycero-D-manno-heptose 1,7-bisphosphate phosphatase